MNNKGFTLMELLAVILILSSISIVAVVSITSSLNRREQKECEEAVAIIKNAAKIYFSLNGSDNGVTVDCLRGEECSEVYFDDKKVTEDYNGINVVIEGNDYKLKKGNEEFFCPGS